MSFLQLPRELRDQIYKELLITKGILDIMHLLRLQDTIGETEPGTAYSPGQNGKDKAEKWRSDVPDLNILNTSRQTRKEGLSVLSSANRFCMYDRDQAVFERLSGGIDYHSFRQPLDKLRARIGQQTQQATMRIQHLQVNIDSSARDDESSHRLMLRALVALAHEVDGKGFSSHQMDQWPASKTAYACAALLPPASRLKTITIKVSGLLHSRSRALLLQAVVRLCALGNIAFRFLLGGSREEDLLFGRQVIDRTVLEQCLSREFGSKVVIPRHDPFVPPRVMSVA